MIEPVRGAEPQRARCVTADNPDRYPTPITAESLDIVIDYFRHG